MKWYTCAVIAFCVLTSCASVEKPHSYSPPNGVVPDEKTAILIAEAVWTPIYGDELLDERPFVARLINGNTWYVNGTLPKRTDGLSNVGGTAVIEISKSDGKILRISHGK